MSLVGPNAVGWVSTELHLSLSQSPQSAREVLLGVDDSIGPAVPTDVGDRVATWLQLDEHEQLSRPFAALSQGEQKLVLLASAIAKRPKLLILDEPMQGLDLSNRRRVLGLVERICRATDTSLIYVTHHFDELIPSLTHALHLQEGRSIFNGTVSAYDPNEM